MSFRDDIGVLQFGIDAANAQAQEQYAARLANLQMSAALNQMQFGLGIQPQPISAIASEAHQGLLIEGTARRIDAA